MHVRYITAEMDNFIITFQIHITHTYHLYESVHLKIYIPMSKESLRGL